MLKRKATAKWEGTLKDGSGSMNFGTYTNMPYSFTSRFENGEGTNPEELIGAAHAGCYSMAFNVGLEQAGFNAEYVQTEATVGFEKKEGGWEITKITLTVNAKVPGISEDKFNELAEGAKKGCPISKALAAVDIELDATLHQ